MTFDHKSLSLEGDMELVYTATSKHYFYFKDHISKFVVDSGKVPLNPFMIFGYFLVDTVDRDLVRKGNNSLVKRADQIWVFGPVSNGVLAEIKIAKGLGKKVRYFNIEKSQTILEIEKTNVELEDEVKDFRKEL